MFLVHVQINENCTILLGARVFEIIRSAFNNHGIVTLSRRRYLYTRLVIRGAHLGSMFRNISMRNMSRPSEQYGMQELVFLILSFLWRRSFRDSIGAKAQPDTYVRSFVIAAVA
jgi:hypothetical protein